MRQIATIKNEKIDAKRLMIYQTHDGIYLFGFDKFEDCQSSWDNFYEDLNEVYEFAEFKYGVKQSEWINIPDPIEGCQDDWIKPVRVVGRISGNPNWGKLETLINDQWIEI